MLVNISQSFIHLRLLLKAAESWLVLKSDPVKTDLAFSLAFD